MRSSQNVPLVMRGPATVASWSPSKLAALDEDTLERITDLYARDPLLSKRLADALAANAIAAESQKDDDTSDDNAMSMQAREKATPTRTGARYVEVIRAAAGFLRKDDGPQIAVFDATGWDTHANEGGAQGQLGTRLGALDAGLRTLKEHSSGLWGARLRCWSRRSSVEPPQRTARAERITGTGAAAFRGWEPCRVAESLRIGRGFPPRALYEGRDLKPTLDLRSS